MYWIISQMLPTLICVILSLLCSRGVTYELDEVYKQKYVCPGKDGFNISCPQGYILAIPSPDRILAGTNKAQMNSEDICLIDDPASSCEGIVYEDPDFNKAYKACVFRKSVCTFKDQFPMWTGFFGKCGKWPANYLTANYLHLNHSCVKADSIHRQCEDTIVRGNEGYILSHNYPATYGTDKECKMSLIPPPNHSVHLVFEKVELFKVGDTCKDYINVTDGDRLLVHQCDSNISDLNVIVQTGKLDILFRSGNFPALKEGFVVKFRVIPLPTTTSSPTTDSVSETSTIETPGIDMRILVPAIIVAAVIVCVVVVIIYYTARRRASHDFQQFLG